MRRTCRKVVSFVVLVGIAAASMSTIATATTPNPPYIEPSADWLTTLNYFRQMAGVNPVIEDAALDLGAHNHSCYMLLNGLTHIEVFGAPGFTADGLLSGKSSNVGVSSDVNASERSHIEAWMAAPFHAIGMLRPNLQRVGFGLCSNSTTSPWHSAATLDVISGLITTSPQTVPILFPGSGSTTNLTELTSESPNPLDFCGWSGAVGLPIVAMMPEGFNGLPNASLTVAAGSTQVCVLSASNTSGDAQLILGGNNAVVIVPRIPLVAGSYTASITTSSRAVRWSFNIDPSANGVLPAPVASIIATGSTLHAVSPTRVVDTRANLGATRLASMQAQRIQIAGTGGVPAGAQAVSANFTVTGSSVAGFLTVWNCSGDRPVVSTLNFGAGETVPNGASVPLDAQGGLCALVSSGADLLVDVNGYYSADQSVPARIESATSQPTPTTVATVTTTPPLNPPTVNNPGGRFAAVAPARLMDSRIGLGAAGRLTAGSVTPLRVTGIDGVPASVSLVVLNVTSVFPSGAGFVTAYPCDAPRPVVSSLNPVPGSARPNLVITPVAADGTLCLFTLTDVDLVVDITGYVAVAAAMKFTPTVPFRLTDTRDRDRIEVNNGTLGSPVSGGQTIVVQVAGKRGIAADAKAVSANITAVGASGAGYVTVWPCGSRPGTSTGNFGDGNAVANGIQTPLSTSGQICIFVSSTVHVIVDINGWWS